jgi:hypothetical protein
MTKQACKKLFLLFLGVCPLSVQAQQPLKPEKPRYQTEWKKLPQNLNQTFEKFEFFFNDEIRKEALGEQKKAMAEQKKAMAEQKKAFQAYRKALAEQLKAAGEQKKILSGSEFFFDPGENLAQMYLPEKFEHDGQWQNGDSTDCEQLQREIEEKQAELEQKCGSAQMGFEFEKKRQINRTFKISPTGKLDIENKFGRVHVNRWDKNEISVEITLIARANSESKAQEILSKLNVDISEMTDIIYCKTQLGSMNSNNQGGSKGFEVNYVVSMPNANPLRVKNSFGDTYIATSSARVELESNYGSLKTDKLLGSDNEVKVSFGNGDITFFRGGRLDVSYSHFKLAEGGKVQLTSGFSEMELGKIDELAVKNKYGEMQITSVQTLSGSASFGDFTVRKLGSSVDMKVQHCGDFRIRSIAKGFRLVNLDGGFSTFDLRFEPETSFTFDIHTSFADVDMPKAGATFSLIDEQNNAWHYKGKMGKLAGGNVFIKSTYGDVEVRSGEE